MNSGDANCTAFLGVKVVASGSLQQVASRVKGEVDDGDLAQLLIFDDATGGQIDVDFRGTTDAVLERLKARRDDASSSDVNEQSQRRVGRPKLGVVSGEVTLLPRHWEWLKSQPGGASVTLRKLVEEARKSGEQQSKLRASQEATYRFMTALAGNFNHYEEALRALYASDSVRFYQLIADWTPDVRDHIQKLAVQAFPKDI